MAHIYSPENSFDAGSSALSKQESKGIGKFTLYTTIFLLTIAGINQCTSSKAGNENPSRLENISNKEPIIKEGSNLMGPYIFEKQLKNSKTYHINPFNYEVQNGK